MSAEIDGTSKGLLGAFAIFTLGSGIATLGAGILLLYRNLGIEYNYGDFNLFMTSIVLIAVGSFLIITLLLGVYGALKDNSNLRLVTLVLLFILFVALAVTGVYGMVSYKTDRLEKSIENEIKELHANYKNATPELQKKTDYLNQRHNCCVSYTGHDSTVFREGIPESCCLSLNCEPNTDNKRYFESCSSVYFATKLNGVFYVAILSLIAAGVVLLTLILYAGLSQRARAGYAAVSRGQLK